MQYEVIFEDGSYSVAEYGSNEEALSACGAHHQRAMRGEPALAGTNVAAVRVIRVLKYDAPPGDLYKDMTLSADVAGAEVDEALKASTYDMVVDLAALAARIRDLSNPLAEGEPHDSNFKAKEIEELSLPWS